MLSPLVYTLLFTSRRYVGEPSFICRDFIRRFILHFGRIFAAGICFSRLFSACGVGGLPLRSPPSACGRLSCIVRHIVYYPECHSGLSDLPPRPIRINAGVAGCLPAVLFLFCLLIGDVIPARLHPAVYFSPLPRRAFVHLPRFYPACAFFCAFLFFSALFSLGPFGELAPFLTACSFFAPDYRKPSRQGCSICPLGGVFCRMGTTKLVEQGANYSEGYIRYPHGLKAFYNHEFFVYAFPHGYAIRMA